MIFHLHRRVYIHGRRIHHGLAGALLTALGAVLMLDDARDFPWRLREHGR